MICNSSALDGPAHFTEDAPRPPVPGEEGLPPPLVQTRGQLHVHILVVLRHPRRPDLDLGYEPEGSASPTPPYLKWAESLHSLLDDQEGIQLFRNFLCQEGCADLLDFWFACSGFRKTSQEKKVKLAKAIYRKYIIDGSALKFVYLLMTTLVRNLAANYSVPTGLKVCLSVKITAAAVLYDACFK
uniref:RGS domain-containing protein n=1 Tax=Neogobius melanostomus TaxID=47308 RepID=A0A8C6T7T0_9GOBI